VEGFREEALHAISNVKWIPAWGEERIRNMVADRKDWCISRQRVWGVPIPIFYCNSCQKYVITDDTIKKVAQIFKTDGSDAWWAKTVEELLPAGFVCPNCQENSFRKETDIMDVWFDSGSSHAAVLEQRAELHWPAELYLEGSDQHRGWFQSSLLTSVATRKTAPYKAVLTHGFVVDGEGRKMSKSVGNVIYPQEVIKQYGADILRLWVASADYKNDIRISKDILKQMAEVYRKIRNTFRYILGNLYDFDPNTDKVPYEMLPEIDRWALLRLEQVRAKVTTAYDEYEFHQLYHTIHNFCAVDLSSIYLDILKDRVYASLSDSHERRAAQTAMYEILISLVSMVAPVLTFTAEEVWQYAPKEKGMPESARLLSWPKERPEFLDKTLEAKWDKLLNMRGEITKALEEVRQRKTIGHSLDAKVTVYAAGENLEILRSFAQNDELANILIVSAAEVHDMTKFSLGGTENMEGLLVRCEIESAKGDKCERCWIYSEGVDKKSEHPSLCPRCADTLSKSK
jgi:isoleucyl-tRNA synthetase